MLRIIAITALLVLAACEQKPAPSPSASPPGAKSPAAAASTASSPAPAAPAAPTSSGEVDHFPSGQTTPEGVACDLVRSYITSKSDFFKACCFVITPGSPERDAYNNFLDETATKRDVGKSSPKSEGGWPVSIAAVYKARPLSSASAGAYGAENFRLISVMFVDIQTPIRHGNTGDGERSSCRMKARSSGRRSRGPSCFRSSAA